MSEDVVEMARFLLVATLALGAAEYTTRRALEREETLRWSILAAVWLVLVGMLMWTVT